MKFRNKKGLSEVVGYVLLIVIAISIALLVYGWLKAQIPKETEKCPEGVSLFISEYNCGLGNKNINLKLKNNGLFNIDGFIVKVSNKSGDLPTLPLEKIEGGISGREGWFYFVDELEPNQEFSGIFKYTGLIAEIQIIPVKYVDEKPILCENSVITQRLEGCN